MTQDEIIEMAIDGIKRGLYALPTFANSKNIGINRGPICSLMQMPSEPEVKHDTR
jgi:hypothetical protein